MKVISEDIIGSWKFIYIQEIGEESNDGKLLSTEKDWLKKNQNYKTSS